MVLSTGSATATYAAYPSTSDIGYAAWLKHFAATLPLYGEQYNISAKELAFVAQLATEFTAWLIECTQHATLATATVYQRHPSIQLSNRAKAAAVPSKRFLLRRAMTLVRRIRAHPTYTPADGGRMGFALAPQVKRSPPLPPSLLISFSKITGQAPMLTWASLPDTTLELQVCRDGWTWRTLELLITNLFRDTHTQPVESTQWHYRARYCWPDWPAGEWGSVVTTWVAAEHIYAVGS